MKSQYTPLFTILGPDFVARKVPLYRRFREHACGPSDPRSGVAGCFSQTNIAISNCSRSSWLIIPISNYPDVIWHSTIFLFLAHLSRRLKVIELLSSVLVRRASFINFLHYHLLLENARSDVNETRQESSLGLGDWNLTVVQMVPMAPMRALRGPPRGLNHVNIKHFFSRSRSRTVKLFSVLIPS